MVVKEEWFCRALAEVCGSSDAQKKFIHEFVAASGHSHFHFLNYEPPPAYWLAGGAPFWSWKWK
jgi:hypothetical protein